MTLVDGFGRAFHYLRLSFEKASHERGKSLVGLKEVSHHLPEGKMGHTKHFAMMGE